ncbi:tripartite tricarboxylate transporter TctB family protein [Mesorhizobium sp. J428]|uniref:tripartite tricarboxylate transporter TctB family protein n=1 Tax=Mesorhizobium sp. J428 TaxID=2898440 RepID=UPI0021516CFB|nr:tripartite tricarboxylate transporter TctB family protein [Mesorhizobium sp. J428]MCR5860042.1 tripartite tricarboxylate transporter TctB family protein [Mesorhizobium sp. J428]
MDTRGIDRTNAVCGAFFILAGLVFGYQSLGVDLGTWLRIGPGGLPLVLSALLILLGVIILVPALRVEGEPVGKIAWRGMLFILLAPLIFGLTVRGLGFVPAVFVTSLFASFASYRMSWWMALLLSFALAVFSMIVFSYGLGLPFQRFGPWLRF